MKKLRFFSSFEEQKQEEIKTTMQMTPAERVADVVVLIRRIYQIDNAKLNIRNKKLNFIHISI